MSNILLAYYDQDGDESVIYDSSQALVMLQKLYGLFPRIVGKGDYAGVSSVPLRLFALDAKFTFDFSI